jgi:hypothetical protein
MRRLGFVTLTQLARIQRLGGKPEDAFRRIVDEAKERNPSVPSVILQREPNGFAILGLPQ